MEDWEWFEAACGMLLAYALEQGALWVPLDVALVFAALDEDYRGSLWGPCEAACRLAAIASSMPFGGELASFFDGLADAWMLVGAGGLVSEWG